MDITPHEFIRTGELAKRLGTTPKTIYKLVSEKHLTRLRDKTYPWPDVQYQYDVYQKNRIRPQPTLKDKQAKEAAMIRAATENLGMENSQSSNDESGIGDDLENEELVTKPNPQRDRDILVVGQQIIQALQNRADGAENSAYHLARALKESINARTAMLSMLEEEGKTLKREEVEKFIQTISRQNRDQWLNWPMRVSTEMAHELGVDPRMMNDVLLKLVRENLERNATLPISMEAND